GERYEQGDPVTVSWTSRNTATIRIDYSSNNGATWNTIADGTPANAGSYSFVPAAIPTRLALVRLVDVDRDRIQGRSDRPFEIMEPRTIGVLVPGTGGQL